MICRSPRVTCHIATSVFRLDLPPGTEQTFYMRLKSSSPLVFPLTLSTVEALAQKDQQVLLFLGLFYGAMLIMAGYNLFLFFSLRDTNYLYLALFIIFYCPQFRGARWIGAAISLALAARSFLCAIAYDADADLSNQVHDGDSRHSRARSRITSPV